MTDKEPYIARTVDQFIGKNRPRSNEDRAHEGLVRSALNNIYLSAMGSDSTLKAIDNSIDNYNLRKLARLNFDQPGTIRAARFEDGLFLSAQVQRSSGVVRYDLEYQTKNDEPQVPRILAIKIGFRPRLVLRSELLSDRQVLPLINEIETMTQEEVESDTPWQNAYSRRELVLATTIARIKNNPELNEPYL